MFHILEKWLFLVFDFCDRNHRFEVGVPSDQNRPWNDAGSIQRRRKPYQRHKNQVEIISLGVQTENGGCGDGY